MAIEAPYYPIIYVRGYAASNAGRDRRDGEIEGAADGWGAG